MLAIAMYDYRLSKEQFFDLTPAQLSALSERHSEKLAMIDLQNSYTRAMIISPHRKKNAPSSKITDFCLLESSSQKTEKTPEQLFSYVQNFLKPSLQAKFDKEKNKENQNKKRGL